MREIDVEELQALMGSDAQVVDVREPGEFAQAHVPGVRLIPMSQLTGRLAEIDKDQTLYLICASGNRSAQVGLVLEQHGYDTVNVVGGTSAWVRAGKPYDQGL
jgi:rhodanese-related sulfurtransferase